MVSICLRLNVLTGPLPTMSSSAVWRRLITMNLNVIFGHWLVVYGRWKGNVLKWTKNTPKTKRHSTAPGDHYWHNFVQVVMFFVVVCASYWPQRKIGRYKIELYSQLVNRNKYDRNTDSNYDFGADGIYFRHGNQNRPTPLEHSAPQREASYIYWLVCMYTSMTNP